MKITDIAFTSYAVTDVPRARKFYEEVLGLTAGSVYEGDGMAFIEYAIGSGFMSIGAGAEAFKPGSQGGVIVFEVDDFDAFVKKLKDSQVKFVMEPMDTGACHIALVEDPDGNRVMVHKKKAV
jgi:predicted enzyme related to lactoylglutathione lyase